MRIAGSSPRDLIRHVADRNIHRQGDRRSQSAGTSVLQSRMSPPWLRTMLRVMASPRPVPPVSELLEGSSRTNGSNTRSRSASAIPEAPRPRRRCEPVRHHVRSAPSRDFRTCTRCPAGCTPRGARPPACRRSAPGRCPPRRSRARVQRGRRQHFRPACRGQPPAFLLLHILTDEHEGVLDHLLHLVQRRDDL